MEKNLYLQKMLESSSPHSASTSCRERGSVMEGRTGLGRGLEPAAV